MSEDNPTYVAAANQHRRWAIVELFGHAKVAGAISKDDVFGTDKLRVDVPRVTFVEEVYEHGAHKCITRVLPEHTTYFGTGAIFSVSIIDEAAAVLAAHKIRHEPIKAWHLRDALEQLTLAEREALLQPQMQPQMQPQPL